MDRGAWQAPVYAVSRKESDTTEWLTHTFHYPQGRVPGKGQELGMQSAK